MTKGDQRLAKEILDLAEQLMASSLSPGVVERQFFFNFWCREYLDGVKKLQVLITTALPFSRANGSLEEFCHQALHDKGFNWLANEAPIAAELIRELSNRYGITWQDILQHIMGSLPLSGYAKCELYVADPDAMLSIAVPPGESTLIIHDPTVKDLKLITKSLRKEFLPRSRRKRYGSNHVRTCACLCLADRAHYGDRGAICQWNKRFPQMFYYHDVSSRETSSGESQFNREKQKLLVRFNLLEHGSIRFIAANENIPTE